MSREGTASRAVDAEALRARFDGDAALIDELAEVFAGEAVDLLSQIESALAAGDAEAVRRAAHTVKGAVGNFCAPAAAAAALALETAGRAGRLEEGASLLERLRGEIGEVQAALARIRRDHRKPSPEPSF